jgi:hypothetical protein
MHHHRGRVLVRAVAALFITTAVGGATAAAAPAFTHFESGQVRPLALSPSGSLL